MIRPEPDAHGRHGHPEAQGPWDGSLEGEHRARWFVIPRLAFEQRKLENVAGVAGRRFGRENEVIGRRSRVNNFYCHYP